jgi:hypothetical protein
MKTILIIGFSLTAHYNRKGYRDLLSNYDKIYFTLPNKYFWKGFSLINLPEIYIKLITFFGFYKNNNSSNVEWINFKFLKKKNSFARLNLLQPNLKHEFQVLKESFIFCKNISSLINKDCFKIQIKGIDCAGYIIDSLQRYAPNFRVYKMRSPLVFVSTWLYVYNIITYLNWLEKFAKKNKIDSVLINHQFYMESGFISCYLNKKFESKIIHFSIKNKYPVFVEPRVKWFKKILDKKLSEALLTNKKIVGEKKNLYDQKHSLFDIEDCSKKNFDTKVIVIIMHAFADSNSMHIENGVIFSSHFQWISSTLSIAKKNKNIKYIFRSHPASFDHYKSDLNVLDYLFDSIEEKNIKLEKPGNYSQFFSADKIPIFITAKSNFSQELAIAGVRCLTLDDSTAPNDSCKRINSKEEYVKWLSGKGDVNQLRLSERQRFAARLNKQIYAELNSFKVR